MGRSTATPRIELLGFDGCPNTGTTRARLAAALGALGISAQVHHVDQEALPPGDRRLGWPAPTILVEGRDLFGLPGPAGSTLSCRVYPGGAPSVEEISEALKAVTSRPAD